MLRVEFRETSPKTWWRFGIEMPLTKAIETRPGDFASLDRIVASGEIIWMQSCNDWQAKRFEIFYVFTDLHNSYWTNNHLRMRWFFDKRCKSNHYRIHLQEVPLLNLFTSHYFELNMDKNWQEMHWWGSTCTGSMLTVIRNRITSFAAVEKG